MLPYEGFSVKWVGFVEHFFTSYGFSQSGSKWRNCVATQFYYSVNA